MFVEFVASLMENGMSCYTCKVGFRGKGEGMKHVDMFARPREATIQFSDVFGAIPGTEHFDASSLYDFDAELTAQVRNVGKFHDAQFSIGYWPELGDYGAVLLEELRRYQQHEAHRKLGTEQGLPEHPDTLVLHQSLQHAVVAVVNCAPRTHVHQERNVNGEEFHVAVTSSGLEVYAQLPYFRGLHARGWIDKFYRIPNDSGAWPEGEQFRSSCVTQVRSNTDVLVQADVSGIPLLDLPFRVAYVDKFGNVRLECAEMAEVHDLLQPGNTVKLAVDGGKSSVLAHVVNRLTDIPEGEVGLYRNPADDLVSSGPGYLEFVRRVSNPNGHAAHAYATLITATGVDPLQFTPDVWRECALSITG